jgi:hypothetical protein
VKGNRKPEGAAPLAGGPTDSESAKAKLLSLLQLACGSSASALDVLDRALLVAGRADLPGTASGLVTFVRAHLMGVLSDEIGPRLTVALVDDLVAELGDPEGAPKDPTLPPASAARPVPRIEPRVSRRAERGLRVALIDADRVERAALARALLRERWDLTVIDTEQDVAPSLAAGTVDVAVVDAVHPAALGIVESLLRRVPELAVVVRSADAARARVDLGRLGVARVEICSAQAVPEDLIHAVRRAARRPGSG